MNLVDNFTQDIAVSKSADNQEDIEAISSVLRTYAEGGLGHRFTDQFTL